MSENKTWYSTCVLTLDQVDSEGREGRPIHVQSERLMALSLRVKSTWFGFILKGVDTSIINPGQSVHVDAVFLDDVGAREAFPLNTSILFGDGVSSRGVLFFQ